MPRACRTIQPKDELLKNTRVEFDGKVLQPVADGADPRRLEPRAVAAEAAAGRRPRGRRWARRWISWSIRLASDGKLLIDAGHARRCWHVTFYGRASRTWRLPLGSVLPPKTDKATGETFPGNYRVQPVHRRRSWTLRPPPRSLSPPGKVAPRAALTRPARFPRARFPAVSAWRGRRRPLPCCGLRTRCRRSRG